MVVFVILNYMTTIETQNLTKSILALQGDKRVIIVDNDSPNDAGNILKNYFLNNKQVDVLLTNSNMGFAKGNNIGYKVALKYNPKFVVILNSDIELIQDDLIAKIDNVYAETKFAVMGPSIVVPETGMKQNPKRMELYSKSELINRRHKLKLKLRNKKKLRIRSFFKQFKLLRKAYLKSQKNNVENILNNTEVGILHGAFVVFSEQFITNFNEPFDNRTFFYFEMEILGIRLKQKGLKSVYSPSVKVLHHQNLSTKKAFKGEYEKTIFQINNMIDSINVCLNYFE